MRWRLYDFGVIFDFRCSEPLIAINAENPVYSYAD